MVLLADTSSFLLELKPGYHARQPSSFFFLLQNNHIEKMLILLCLGCLVVPENINPIPKEILFIHDITLMG